MSGRDRATLAPSAHPWLAALESEGHRDHPRGRRIRDTARDAPFRRQGLFSASCTWRARRSGPPPPPMRLLHVDTTWKFREMIAFRDRVAAEAEVELIVHTNQEGVDAGVTPFTHGSDYYTEVMKTVALRQALDAGHYDMILIGARRDEEKSRAKERVFSVRNARHQWDPKTQRPEPWTLYKHPSAKGRITPCRPALKLVRSRCLALHRRGGDPRRATLLRRRAPRGRTRRPTDHGGRRPHAAQPRRSPHPAPRPLPLASGAIRLRPPSRATRTQSTRSSRKHWRRTFPNAKAVSSTTTVKHRWSARRGRANF